MKITINPKIDNRVKFKDVKPGETFTTLREGGLFLKVDNSADSDANAIVLVPLEHRLAADAFKQTIFNPETLVIIIPSELRVGVEPEKVVSIDKYAEEIGHDLWTSLTGDPLNTIGQPGVSNEKDKAIKR